MDFMKLTTAQHWTKLEFLENTNFDTIFEHNYISNDKFQNDIFELELWRKFKNKFGLCNFEHCDIPVWFGLSHSLFVDKSFYKKN